MKKIYICILAFICLAALTSCFDGIRFDSSGYLNKTTSSGLFFRIPNQTVDGCHQCSINYDVFKSGSLEFNVEMLDNPIDKKMREEALSINMGSARDPQVFYSKYVYVWQNELEYSVENLKKYLSGEDQCKLDLAQKAWDDLLELDGQILRGMMGRNGVHLGTQFVGSNLEYLIDQYRGRVFYIKYLTYLAETHVANKVPEEEQLWSLFLEH